MKNDKSYINVVNHKILEILTDLKEVSQIEPILSERCSTAERMPMISRMMYFNQPKVLAVKKR